MTFLTSVFSSRLHKAVRHGLNETLVSTKNVAVCAIRALYKRMVIFFRGSIFKRLKKWASNGPQIFNEYLVTESLLPALDALKY